MKHIVILGDGMADRPLAKLEGKTPLEVAYKPYMDQLAMRGQVGMVHTVPKGMSPGSDTANLSVMGYNPEECYTGRSPLEALSMGVHIEDDDVTYRVNLVTLTEDDHQKYEDKKIVDHSGGEISTEEARELIQAVAEALGTEIQTFYPGISYRHLLVWNGGSTNVTLIPPHDIRGQFIKEYLPKGDYDDALMGMMKKSYDILENHPININRRQKGLLPANSIWIWGEGTKPQLTNFFEKYKIKGSMISAVDLLKGIGAGGGLQVEEVEGATGTLHTNYRGKVDKALEVMEQGIDFVYIHVEAPDECGHVGDLEGKIKAIEEIDEKIIKTLVETLDQKEEPYRILLLPDHPTPIDLCTHTSDPVPFVLFDSRRNGNSGSNYTEKDIMQSDWLVNKGYELMDKLIQS